MGRKANKGSEYGRWRAPTAAKDVPTRQSKRAELRAITWKRWRCYAGPDGHVFQGPRDDRGAMSRRVRRSIALSIARRAYVKMKTETPTLTPFGGQ